MIICSFFSRICTLSSSSRCSTKASWASLEMAVLTSGGLAMAIAAYNSWGELIYHFSGTDLMRSIFVLFFAVSFKKLSLLCCNNANDWVITGGRSTSFEILSCAIDLLYGSQCKCQRKRWFMFYAFLWTCWETAKSQALEIVYCTYAGALKGW